MPPPKSSSTPLSDFIPLTPAISLYKPPPTPQTHSPNAPSLIILSTWFKALPKHVSKYTATYQRLYPHATILLLSTSIPDMVYRSYSTQQKNLLPCLPIIQECIQSKEGRNGEILFHIFSNSGAHTACQLARAYKSRFNTALQVGALIIDSAPGKSSYRENTDGFIAALPSTPVLKQLLSLVVYGLTGSITVKEALTGETHWIEKMRDDLNDGKLFEVGERGRCYFFGKRDAIVGWKDVETYVEDTKALGGNVRVERWESTGHVGHMTGDGERYWGTVKEVWDGDLDERALRSKL